MSAVRRSTKGQVQLLETIAVLVVFSILLVFGLYWFGSSQTDQVEQQKTDLENLELLEMTKAIMNLPEIQCSIAGRPDTSCVDKLRLEALNKTIEENTVIREYYENRYRTNTRATYAAHVVDISNNEYTYELFNYTTNQPSASRQQQAVPAVIYDPLTQRRNLSMIVLTQEVIE